MHDKRLLVEERVDRLIVERLEPAIYRATTPLTLTAWHAPGEPVPFAEAAAAPYVPFAVGDAWGRPWATTWMRMTGSVPTEWFDGDQLPTGLSAEVVVDLGFDRGQTGFQCEALAYGHDGVPLKGIAPFNSSVTGAVDDRGQVDILVEAAANPDVGSDWTFTPTPVGDLATAGDVPVYRMKQADIALLDQEVWGLLHDAKVLRGLIGELPVGSPRRALVLGALERMADTVDPHDVAGTAAAGRAVLADALARPASASAHELHAVGHAHIDSAWLWPVRETIRKCSRTFSNAIALMDADPEFTFAASSAQQYAWMKQYYPALFERIKEKVAAGQFIPVGGMWVESDTNLPGGEAMARQFVAGKGFFQREFGVDCEEVWLPDSFGYSGALPQIVRAAGMRWFLTQKISWNETNRMPHHTFRWEGIDGTRVFTHFPPVDKYNSDLVMSDLAHAERNFADAGRSTMSLLPYGYGDGGGGPTREMVAVVDRVKSLEGSPRLTHSTPRRFFEAAEAEYPEAEVWSGEMYLESHRGTYTSQLATKQGNRRSEHLLREAELWATTASVRTGAEYPTERLAALWKLVLLQQFHDILPGSSIAWVHQDAERNYTYIAGELEQIIETAMRSLVGDGSASVTFNATPHGRGGVPALGAAVAVASDAPTAGRREGETIVLENPAARVVIDARGTIASFVDHASGRECIPPETVGGLLQLHRDTPNKWDAWDIDWHYRSSVVDVTEVDDIRLEDDGTVVVERSFGDSHIVERLRLLDGTAEIALDLEIDWQEKQKLLKLAFPVDVHADRFASEIQFGHIERPTHTNTSWDAARYETSAHRWIFAEEPGYGAAVVNDSTYGYDVTRQERVGGGSTTLMRMSLIRSALFPDPKQDIGMHTVRVGLIAGAGTLEAVQAGYSINLPPRTVTGASTTGVAPIVTVSNPGVIVEAVKLAEDGSGDVVVRLYEALGARSSAIVTAGFEAVSVVATDLLERAVTSEVTSGGSLALQLRAFEIVTLRFAR